MGLLRTWFYYLIGGFGPIVPDVTEVPRIALTGTMGHVVLTGTRGRVTLTGTQGRTVTLVATTEIG